VLFQQSQQQKKKKVRPEEKKKMEVQNTQKEEEYTEDVEGGFSVFKKKGVTKPRVQQYDEGQGAGEQKEQRFVKNKGAHEDRNRKVQVGKRVFDKQSGTGRGKEIAKGGAGGKHTWGADSKTISRKADEEYNYDESVFDRVLNAKPRQPRTEEEPETKPEYAVEDKPQEKLEEGAKKEENPDEATKEGTWREKERAKMLLKKRRRTSLRDLRTLYLSLSTYRNLRRRTRTLEGPLKPEQPLKLRTLTLKPRLRVKTLPLELKEERRATNPSLRRRNPKDRI